MPSLRDGAEVFMGAIPFFHVYGMTACMNLSIATGGTIVLLPRFATKDVLKAIVSHVNPIFAVRKKGTIGLPLPDTDAKLVDLETGEREVPIGQPGELMVKG